MSTNFMSTLAHYREMVWPEVNKRIEEMGNLPEYCNLDDKYRYLLDKHLEISGEYSKRKGKYLRPSLLLLTAEAMGANLSECINTAVAMQLSEDWILNHDDIEDQSAERRGGAALYRIYGKELAINAGDALQTVMWKVIGENFKLLEFERASKIYEEFYQILNRTTLGQTIDIYWNQNKEIELKPEDVYLTLESKTGYYTIAGPMRLGALLAGGNKGQLEEIYKFGVTLGRVFQIVDDILDLTSTFHGLKKQTGNDIYENKKTIMLVHLLSAVKGKDKDILSTIIRKERDEKSEDEVKTVIKLMEKYGSIDYARAEATRFSKHCLETFDSKLQFISKSPFREQIREGVEFIATRDH